MSITPARGFASFFRSINEDESSKKLVLELAAYGLTINQARIYLFLLSKNPSSAREIAKGLGLHRVDVYRKLRELEELGMLSTYFGLPKRFSAVDSRIALTSLIRRMRIKVTEAERSSIVLKRKLERHQSAQRPGNQGESRADFAEDYYKFGVGARAYYDELRHSVRTAAKSISNITSHNGLKRAFLSGFYKDIKRASERGIPIRMISDVNSDNIDYALKLSEFLELRHISNLHFRFLVSDDSRVVLSAKFDDSYLTTDSISDRFFVFNDPIVASALSFLFDHLWADAVEPRKIPPVE